LPSSINSLALVGHSKMSHADVVENIIAAANQISTSVAGGATNIKQLNIKTCYSLSIPIYMAKGLFVRAYLCVAVM
jgi:ribosomal protein L1